MKDNFSINSDNYAKFRPDYPQAVFDFLYPLLKEKNCAWDCATGNGQIAQELSKSFASVQATDISQAQLDHTYKADNISYSLQAAEKTTFAENSFDLVTVGQAIHWFDFDKFYHEVDRVVKPQGIIAILGYELNHITPEIDAVVRDFYNNTVGSYWDTERQYVQQQYQTIPFPFRELETPEITNIKLWSLDNMIGYLKTWSAVKHFIAKNGYDPVDQIKEPLRAAWGNTEMRKVSFPILFRVGRIR